jgi:DNA-binding NarL/FixJ family response regulator
MLRVMLVEDSRPLRDALAAGLEQSGQVKVVAQVERGEDALERGLADPPDVVLMDVGLAGEMNGIQAAVALRRELPRLPIVFYSIQDDDEYFRTFRRAGILSHYAYVRKSNYLLPSMILPLLKDAASGRSFIDPEIEARVQEVRLKDEHSPMALLEPTEQAVALLLAQGLNNEQIAARLGFHDKRSVSRVNGQIYTAWGLGDTTTDEKVARTRVSLIVRAGRLIQWRADGSAWVQDDRGAWLAWEND